MEYLFPERTKSDACGMNHNGDDSQNVTELAATDATAARNEL